MSTNVPTIRRTINFGNMPVSLISVLILFITRLLLDLDSEVHFSSSLLLLYSMPLTRMVASFLWVSQLLLWRNTISLDLTT